MSNVDLESLTVRDLRRRWKPTKEGVAAGPERNTIRVRLHRCWSWLERVEELAAAGVETEDDRLIYGWVALNSLYGRWDWEQREPVNDLDSLTSFLERLWAFDHDGALPALLLTNRALARSIVGDEYLSRFFWKYPGQDQIRSVRNLRRKFDVWLEEGHFAKALDLTLKRVYLARCQLIHGGATYRSSLNRASIGRCAAFVQLFVRAASLIIVDHAWEEDWGDICYPPMDDGQNDSQALDE